MPVALALLILAVAPWDMWAASSALAASNQPQEKAQQDRNNETPSPEEQMRRRFPHPIKVGDLIGLAVLDWHDSTIGYVSQVVRTPGGKIQLIVPYSSWFGWAQFMAGKRLVAVPIEKVAMLGRQIAAMEMPREEFDTAPTWTSAGGMPIPPGDMIQIALTKR